MGAQSLIVPDARLELTQSPKWKRYHKSNGRLKWREKKVLIPIAQTIQILTIAMERVVLVTGNRIGMNSGDKSYEIGREKEVELGKEDGGGASRVLCRKKIVVRVKDHLKRAWCIPLHRQLLGD